MFKLVVIGVMVLSTLYIQKYNTPYLYQYFYWHMFLSAWDAACFDIIYLFSHYTFCTRRSEYVIS